MEIFQQLRMYLLRIEFSNGEIEVFFPSLSESDSTFVIDTRLRYTPDNFTLDMLRNF